MPRRSIDYQDAYTKEKIKDAIRFFQDSGLKDLNEIYDIIAKDFGVSKTAVLEAKKEMEKKLKNNNYS